MRRRDVHVPAMLFQDRITCNDDNPVIRANACRT